MPTFDVTVMVRLRIETSDHNRAENTALDLLDRHLGDMLDCPAVVEVGVPLTAQNPSSVEVIPNERRSIMLTAQCVVCRQIQEIHCTAEQFQAWQIGALLQNAMPDTPPAEREMLLSGICGECWKDTFRDGEED